MAGIPPSNPSLDRFRQVGENEQVSLHDGANDLTRQEKTGKLGERFARWITGTNDTENNRATKAFFDALEQAYGKRATEWAVDGYEDRLTDGKPLSGYRIQQILARAEDARMQDKNALKQLVDDRTPVLVGQALERAGLQFPEGTEDNWRKSLENKIKQDIRQSDKFKDPGQLETASFRQEFGAFVNGRINGYMEALRQVGTFEERRQQVMDDPEVHGNWGMMHPSQLDRYVFTDRCRQNFLAGFGSGENKINNFDSYWNDKVIAPGQQAITSAYGPDRKFERYGDIFWDRSSKDYKDGTNGIYRGIGQQDSRGFAEFCRLDTGMTRAGALNNVRDEKFHISVDPKDIGLAWEKLAPILLGKDCPLTYWKVGDIDAFGQAAIEARSKLEDFDRGEDVEYDGKLLGQYAGHKVNNQMPEEDRKVFRKELEDRAKDLQRAYESCQFTLYPMNGEDSSKFVDLLDEIEQTLRGAGLTPSPTPESDEGVTGFVSFRIGAKEVDGRKVRIDPNSEGYEEFRQTFRDNPFYLGQGYNLVSNQINRLRDKVGKDNEELGAEIEALRTKVGSMDLSDDHRRRLEARLKELDESIRK